jgi:hypothetical protein
LPYRLRFFFGLFHSTRCGCDRKHYCKTLWSWKWIWHFLHLGYHGNGLHFEFFSTPQKLPHTTVDIPTKFHEVWWKESKIILNPPFFFPWQLHQSLSNRFWFFWLILFH